MKFKVGDIVRGKEKSSSRYGITNENMYRGRIVKVADDDYIDIEILEHKDKEFIGKKYIHSVSYTHLTLPTILRV